MGKVDTNVANAKVATTPKTQSRFVREFLKNYPLFIMVLPGVLLVATFAYAPMVGLIMAFKKFNLYDGMFGSPFCGLDNFKFLFLDRASLLIRNTLGYNLVFIICGMILALALAIALSELRGTKCKKIYQTIIIMPHFLSIVIVSYLVYAFLNPVAGTVNNTILPALGILAKNPDGGNTYSWAMWYNIPKIWPYVLIFVNFWKGVGYSSIVYVASIAGIDQEMYEAAVIDGASKWQQITEITIPMLIPLMIILGTLNVGKIFNADFGLFYQVPRNQGALKSVTEVIDTYVYQKKIEGASSVGPATAAGLFQSICSFILVLTTNAIVRKVDPERSLF
ncbi:MAG: ABC transporter permease subunit [Eubacteriales bacterium]|nr:ABC transporter permease subunit [Eubacteriales bacterium]